MKYLVIALSVLAFGLINPSTLSDAKAQTKSEVRQERLKKRRINRKTRVAAKRTIRRRVTRTAHLKYSRLPKWRTVVVSRPANAILIKRNGVSFHYSNGIFYRPMSSKFIVVRPEVGIRVSVLPPSRRVVSVRNTEYFYYYGTFYTAINGGREYEVISAPVGALVDSIPDGYDIQSINGREYYALDDVYYQEVITDEMEGGIGYEVVKV